MSTGTPVIVSRIQNRRGTQSQFDNLYPGEYISSPGAQSTMNVVTVTSTDGLFVGRPVYVKAGIGQFADGTKVISIDSGTQFTVDLDPAIPLSGTDAIVYSPKYSGQGGATGPDILQPGEIGLCTDTRRVFIGNLNGEYVELTDVPTVSDIVILPVIVQLDPSPDAFVPIPALTHTVTPFLTFVYSIVDQMTSNPNTVGNKFSRNGEMKITAIVAPSTIPPHPVTLTDTSTEINTSDLIPSATPPYTPIQPDIQFIADYDTTGSIRISYMHNFPTPLTLSTSTTVWISL